MKVKNKVTQREDQQKSTDLMRGFYLESPLAYLTEVERYRIAIEMFLVKSLTHIHYNSLMSDVPEGTASKDSLISWINDRNTTEKEDGYGVITRYKISNPDHFENGKWKAEKFGHFLGYASELLRDPNFFGKNKGAYRIFRDSFKSDEWWYKATSVIALKLLEDLYKNNGMLSIYAEEVIRTNFATREILSASGRIVGRVGKNSELRKVDQDRIVDLINGIYPEVFIQTKRSHFYFYENILYSRYFNSIQTKIEQVRKKSLEGLHEQLNIFN